MCGRYTSTSPIEVLAETFEVDEIRVAEVEPGTIDPATARYNVAPTQPVLAVATRRVRDEGEGNVPVRALGTFRWGLVPSWAKDPSVGSRMINARAEGIATKPAYRKALVRRRCLIPADAFYEWQVPSGPKGSPRQPWAVRLRSGAPMAFAGLWEVWRDRSRPEAEPLRTCVIVTTEANERLRGLHDRMPVVLDPEVWDRWLDPDVDDTDELTSLLVPAPGDRFETVKVSTAVNQVKRDGPELLEPLVDA